MKRNARFSLIAIAAALSLGLGAPPAAAGVDFFGIHVGGDGFGLSMGFSDWGVYGRSWSDPAWSVDYVSALSGYGEWVWVDGLGRVWRPWVAPEWRPYTHGRWVTTSRGWTWVAYEPWGYFPHHYGSWALTTFGWVWQPGYSYVPASVVWVRAGSYVGWYPSAPRGWSHARRAYHHGYDHGYGHGRHDGYHEGYADGWRDARYATYVQWNDLASEDIAPRTVPAAHVQRRAMARPQVSAAPPSSTEVRGRGVRDVPRVRLEERTVRSGDRTLTVARPEGMTRSVQRHAEPTVRRALSRDVVDRIEQRVKPGASSRSDRPSATSQRSASQPRTSGRDAVRRDAAPRQVEERRGSSSRELAVRPSTSSRGAAPSHRPSTVNRAPDRSRAPQGADRAPSPWQDRRQVTSPRSSSSASGSRSGVVRKPATAQRARPSTRRAPVTREATGSSVERRRTEARSSSGSRSDRRGTAVRGQSSRSDDAKQEDSGRRSRSRGRRR